MRPGPPQLLTVPFDLDQARVAGVSPRILEGRRFVQVLPRVYPVWEHDMTPADWVLAAKLTLPDHALLTSTARMRDLGLAYGPLFPLRFMIEGDHHRALDRVFLHRTSRLPP